MPAAKRAAPLLWLATAAVAGGLLFWFLRDGSVSDREPGPTASEPTRPSPTPDRAASTTSAPPEKAPSGMAALNRAADELASAPDRAAALKILAALRAELLALPRAEAARAVSDFLAARRDVPTKLSFAIGQNGSMREWPTLRTYLLDLLGEIDPAAGAAIARQVLEKMESPDEWALSLRNCAKVDGSPEGTAYLQQKFLAMLGNESWRRKPSVGFLEAFDVVVQSHGTNLTAPLAEIVRRNDNPALTHAAYLTLDRLVIQDTAATLGLLQNDPALMAGREVTRANYFARADVRDPAQRALVESYLLDTRRTPQELDTFAGLFPNENYMVSNNLLTPTVTPAGDEIAVRDRQSLATVDAWLADARFASLRPRLEKLRERLAAYVRP